MQKIQQYSTMFYEQSAYWWAYQEVERNEKNSFFDAFLNGDNIFLSSIISRRVPTNMKIRWNNKNFKDCSVSYFAECLNMHCKWWKMHLKPRKRKTISKERLAKLSALHTSKKNFGKNRIKDNFWKAEKHLKKREISRPHVFELIKIEKITTNFLKFSKIWSIKKKVFAC